MFIKVYFKYKYWFSLPVQKVFLIVLVNSLPTTAKKDKYGYSIVIVFIYSHIFNNFYELAFVIISQAQIFKQSLY